MSGICGIYKINNQLVTKEEISKMNHAMQMLGPDGSGVWHAGVVGFGHQALHITDEDINDVLPKYEAATKIALTADCRLDNRASLCKSFNFDDEPSLSDSFLILCAYRKWGKDCPKYLLGEFAVAIWDDNLQELVCFVDHTGCRIFYYYHDENIFAFSTEIHALHTLQMINRKPNLERIAAHGNTSYLLSRPEITCYENVFKISARTILVVKNKQLKKQVYWTPDINQRITFSCEDEYIEAFQILFSEIVRSKLRSHYPVLTLHSGGLDSSSITAMAANILAQDNRQLTALSAVLPPHYQGDTIDESLYINLLKNQNLSIQSVIDLWRGPFDSLDDQYSCMKGFDKTSRHYLYTAFATAASSHGARIILDGCFGEKGPSFHGNGYYAELLATFRWRTLLRESRLHCEKYDRPWLKFMARELVMPLLPANAQARINLRSDIRLSQSTSFIKSTFTDAYVDRHVFNKERIHLNTQYPNSRYHQYQAMNYLYSQASFIYDDINQPVYMSYPYNDKRMLEFCLAIPSDLKVRNGYKRYAIRSGMRGLMPDELRYRTTKEPFSPDYHDRYNRQLIKAREFIANVPRTSLMKEIVDIEKLETALNYSMQTNRCATTVDFTAMHSIPFSVYLMAFLGTF